jgi:hypothetical protein
MSKEKASIAHPAMEDKVEPFSTSNLLPTSTK